LCPGLSGSGSDSRERAASVSSGEHLSLEQAVGLCRHDEIVFVQSPDFVRVKLDAAVTPAVGDVRVVEFFLAEIPTALAKACASANSSNA